MLYTIPSKTSTSSQQRDGHSSTLRVEWNPTQSCHIRGTRPAPGQSPIFSLSDSTVESIEKSRWRVFMGADTFPSDHESPAPWNTAKTFPHPFASSDSSKDYNHLICGTYSSSARSLSAQLLGSSEKLPERIDVGWANLTPVTVCSDEIVTVSVGDV